MAWGGMHVGNGRKAWAARAHWLPLCDEIRAGKHTRKNAYNEFAKLRASKKLPGMGPAYFTKIIFFSSPSHDGYILDQWTARSIHILTDQDQIPLVQKESSTVAKAKVNPFNLKIIVSDKTTANDYEDYCQRVEDLAVALGVTPHRAEEMMFSSGAPHQHPWREHVRSAWPPFYL